MIAEGAISVISVRAASSKKSTFVLIQGGGSDIEVVQFDRSTLMYMHFMSVWSNSIKQRLNTMTAEGDYLNHFR